MIQSTITGGLGNQLFQYATAKNLARLNNTDLYLNLDWYNQDFLNTTKRKFDLSYFQIKYKDIKSLECRVKNKIWPARYITEKNSFSYETNLLDQKGKNISLSGYWAFHPYFDDIRDILMKEVRPRTINNENNQFLDRICKSNSVSLHIRRGDYISDSLFKVLELEYYENAVSKIKELVEEPSFFVFSDDIDFVKTFFKEDNYQIVDINLGENSYMDLYLMSQCKHNVLANSTFSWWAAYLNSNNGKTVIAPSQWHNENNDYYKEYRDKSSESIFYMEDWIIV